MQLKCLPGTQLLRKISGKLLVIEALSGGEPVSLPLASGLLHTMHFKVAQDSSPSDDVKQFASIIWECLQILRENYPSRIDLTEEGLDRCSPYFTDLSKTELMRREVSCIASRRDDPALVTSEEIVEVWFVLYTALKLHDARAVLLCLQLLADSRHCPASLFRNVRQSERNLLETLLDEAGIAGFSANLEEQCRSLAREVLELCGKEGENRTTLSEGELSQRLSIQSGAYDPPSSVRALIFQLNETVCVERATFLLECLTSTPSSDPSQSSVWLESLSSVLHKYCQGVYGSEDHDVIRYGLFQCEMGQCIARLAASPETFVTVLSMGLLLRLMEVAEEACLLAHRLIVEKAETPESRLFDFLHISLNLCELCISPAFYKHLRPLLDSLYKVDSRLLSFIDPGDRDLPAPTDPEELKALSPHLSSIREHVRALITRVEALTDYQESYEEKYKRLFAKLASK